MSVEKARAQAWALKGGRTTFWHDFQIKQGLFRGLFPFEVHGKMRKCFLPLKKCLSRRAKIDFCILFKSDGWIIHPRNGWCPQPSHLQFFFRLVRNIISFQIKICTLLLLLLLIFVCPLRDCLGRGSPSYLQSPSWLVWQLSPFIESYRHGTHFPFFRLPDSFWERRVIYPLENESHTLFNL